MDAAKIEVRGAQKTFFGRGQTVHALDPIDVEIREGEVFGLVGPSGCGKSTLLRMIAGLLEPSGGEVRIDGTTVHEPRRATACVFQDAALLPWRTVRDNVTFGLTLHGTPRARAREQAREALEMVGLTGFDDKYPNELSGGMQQRVSLARAFVVGSEILLMDEPFGALDSMTRQILQGELLRLVDQFSWTVCFVTHQIDEAVLLSDRVAVMSRRPGRLKGIFDVPFERPRSPSINVEPAFRAVCDDIWGHIETEVRASMGELATA